MSSQNPATKIIGPSFLSKKANSLLLLLHKGVQAYSAEGLTDSEMSFENFAQIDFQRELKLTKRRVEDRAEKKRKLQNPQHQGRLCRFCRTELKQGPNSRHIHTGFPGVAGKYIYCPAKVLNLYNDRGMTEEMKWREFQSSAFYDMERERWAAEKQK